MIDEFTRQGIPFFNRDVYDLFYMGYGDTVPSTGFIAAGMTFEKASGDPTPRRVYEQYLTQWVSLSAAAINADDILARWHGAWVEARRQGRRRRAGAQRDHQPWQRAGHPGARPAPAPLVPARRRPGQGRASCAPWSGACSGWT